MTFQSFIVWELLVDIFEKSIIILRIWQHLVDRLFTILPTGVIFYFGGGIIWWRWWFILAVFLGKHLCILLWKSICLFRDLSSFRRWVNRMQSWLYGRVLYVISLNEWPIWWISLCWHLLIFWCLVDHTWMLQEHLRQLYYF